MSSYAPDARHPGQCVLRHVSETNIVRATLLGALDLEAFVRCASEAAVIAPRHGTLHLLLDARRVQPRENVFVNRRYTARSFVDEDRALQWLPEE